MSHLASMPELKPLTIRSCPVCWVAMLRYDFGWSCPQCGSAIIEPARGEAEPRSEAEQSGRVAPSALRG